MMKFNAILLLALGVSACQKQSEVPTELMASVRPAEKGELGRKPDTDPTRAVATRSKKPFPVLAVAERVFTKEIGIRKATLENEIGRLNKKSYDEFLAERKNRAEGCHLDPAVLEIIEQYRAASDLGEQDAFLKKLRNATKDAVGASLGCVDALAAKIDDNGILLSGLLADKKPGGKQALKPTIRNEGWVFILWPQIVTRWPGRPDSAVAILDPTEAPWEVRMAYTYEEKVETFSQAWKFKSKLKVEDYLRLKKNHGHFLLVDRSNKPIGWLDMDLCAFYHKAWKRYMRRSRDVFKKGLATALHGANYHGEIICPDTGPDRSCNDTIEWFDFLSLVHGTATLKHQRRRYRSNGMLNLDRMRDATIDELPLGDVDVVLMSNTNEDPADAMFFNETSARLSLSSSPGELPLRFGPGSKKSSLDELKTLVGR